MTTTFIGLKELRQNMAKVSEEAIRKNQRVIVLKKNAPVFELRPLTKEDIALWSFERELIDARSAARNGKTYTTHEVREILALGAV
ncbi:MAG: hypothetical protein WCJ29_03125 [bacterium]